MPGRSPPCPGPAPRCGLASLVSPRCGRPAYLPHTQAVERPADAPHGHPPSPEKPVPAPPRHYRPGPQLPSPGKRAGHSDTDVPPSPLEGPSSARLAGCSPQTMASGPATVHTHLIPGPQAVSARCPMGGLKHPWGAPPGPPICQPPQTAAALPALLRASNGPEASLYSGHLVLHFTSSPCF